MTEVFKINSVLEEEEVIMPTLSMKNDEVAVVLTYKDNI